MPRGETRSRERVTRAVNHIGDWLRHLPERLRRAPRAAGISNRPLEEEARRQGQLPPRGAARGEPPAPEADLEPTPAEPGRRQRWTQEPPPEP
jgi:hypothetical protein